jgi:sugar phosphate isomerase/epimerase
MEWSRRQVLGTASVRFGRGATAPRRAQAPARPPAPAPRHEPFGYCLNTSTIRGNNLGIAGVVAAASKAGFHAIEPWIMEIDAYTKGGGTLKDLGKRIADAGLTIESAIAFNSFVNDDEAQRATSMERLKLDMDKVAQIGGTRIAAPPGNNRAAVSPTTRRVPACAEIREDGRAAAAELWGRIRCSGRSRTAST